MKSVLYVVLVILFLLHNDLWLWKNATLISGIPVTLLYHVGYCVAASILMIWLVRRAWPDRLEVEPQDDQQS